MGNLSTGASTLLVESDALSEIGGFNPKFPRHQDWEFLIRILQHGKLAHVNKPLVIKHGTGSPSADVYAEAKELLLTTFADEVERLEDEGYPITHIQNTYLAKQYFERGYYKQGMRRLDLSELTISEFLSIFWSAAIGVRESLA